MPVNSVDKSVKIFLALLILSSLLTLY